MRILYVEDNETNQSLVGRVVRARRHKIVFSEEGEQALQLLSSDSNIDLVLLDIELAGNMNGVEVVKQMRARQDTRPVVAVTAYAMMGDRERFLEAGCDQYLPKPLVITDLLALIDHYEAELESSRVTPSPTHAPVEPAVKSEPVHTEVPVATVSNVPAEPVVDLASPPEPAAASDEPESQLEVSLPVSDDDVQPSSAKPEEPVKAATEEADLPETSPETVSKVQAESPVVDEQTLSPEDSTEKPQEDLVVVAIKPAFKSPDRTDDEVRLKLPVEPPPNGKRPSSEPTRGDQRS